MAKRALIISGGGAKGAYAVGALDHMVNKLRLQFDLVAGTSTGALISPLALLGSGPDIQELITIYTSVKNSDILKPREIGFDSPLPISFNETGPLKKLIARQITEHRAGDLLDADKRMFLTTVNMQTGKIVYFYTGPEGAVSPQPETELVRIVSRQMLIEALLASASIPVFMPPVNIAVNPAPPQQYVDGGLRELTPLKIAIDNGATELYVIMLSPKPQAMSHKFKNFLEVLIQILDLYGRDVMVNDLQLVEFHNLSAGYIEAVKKRLIEKFGLTGPEIQELFSVPGTNNPFEGKRPVSIKIMQPDSGELTGTLEFNPMKMKKIMEMGKQKAVEVLGAFPPTT